MGIDRISVSVPIGDRDDAAAWGRSTGRRRETWVEVGAAKVLVWSANGFDGLLHAGVDLNPSGVLRDDPLFVCPLDQLSTAMKIVWPEVTRRTDAGDDWLVAQVKRIDLTRDFIVDDPVRVIEALIHIPRSRAKRHYTWHDPLTTAVTGLTLATSKEGPTSGNRRGQKVTIYDKGAQLQRPEINTVRWEARCQAWAREIGKITYGYEITRPSIDHLAWDRWTWSKAGTSMGNERTLVDAVIALGLSATDTEALIGHAAVRSAGRALILASATRRKRDRWLRDLNLALSSDNPYVFGSRLDLALGREVQVGRPRDESASDSP